MPTRITDLLDVGAASNDSLPGYICCKRRLELREKAVEDLVNFSDQAKTCQRTLAILVRGPLKRTKR